MIKRYGFGLRAISVGHGESVKVPDIVEQVDGEFVRYDDHEAVLESIGAGGVSGPITSKTKDAIDINVGTTPWQPIGTAPHELESRILATNGFSVTTCYWSPIGWVNERSAGGALYSATHWMPLPEPPKPV